MTTINFLRMNWNYSLILQQIKCLCFLAIIIWTSIHIFVVFIIFWQVNFQVYHISRFLKISSPLWQKASKLSADRKFLRKKFGQIYWEMGYYWVIIVCIILIRVTTIPRRLLHSTTIPFWHMQSCKPIAIAKV